MDKILDLGVSDSDANTKNPQGHVLNISADITLIVQNKLFPESLSHPMDKILDLCILDANTTNPQGLCCSSLATQLRLFRTCLHLQLQ